MGFFSGLLGIDDNKGEKQDRARQLSGWDAEWGNITKSGNMADKLFPQSAGLTTAGAGGVGTGLDYWKSVLTSRPGQAQFSAPATNAVVGQLDQARTNQAQMGTSRGGGVAGTNQQTQQQAQGVIANNAFGAAPAAAQGAVQAGGVMAGIGADQLAAALQSLGLSAQQIQHIVNSSIGSQPVQDELGKRTSPFDFKNIAKSLLGVAGI